MAKTLSYVIASWRLPSNISRDDVHLLGGKAVGLLRLPSEWVPPFIIFTRKFCELLQRKGIKEVSALLPPSEFDLVQDFLSSLSSSSLRALVRSNAPCEGVTITPGTYSSKVTEADLASVAAGIDQICEAGSDIVPCLVQRCLEPAMIGHMSNERRVSFERSLWIVEGLPRKTNTWIRAHIGESSGSLVAKNENSALEALRKVARRLCTLKEGYFHCEWAWTGERVWIVQADARPPTITYPAANKYISSGTTEAEPFVPGTSRLQHFLDVKDHRWKKLRRPMKFHELGLPYADVYLLTGEHWNIAKNEKFINLLPDLTKMCIEPVIIRCDISDDVHDEDLFLPTSSPTKNPEKLIEYMKKISKYFLKSGVDDQNWAFLLARVVKAKASAMIQARPEKELIQVDALWGYPDGLLYYPHDKYYYDCRDRTTVEKRSFKGFCLICNDEAWKTLPVNPPLDWGYVLSPAEVETLAKWALSLANNLDHEIQLMALVRVSGQRGAKGCLPWHYTQLETDRLHAVMGHSTLMRPMHIVRSWADLNRLKAITDSIGKVKGFLIYPDADTLRDKEFLRVAATWAAEVDIPIFFEGSLLGHAYYKMAETGAAVIALSERRISPKTKRYEKIVRDLIPTVIRRAGGIARVRTLPLDEAITLLAQKLIEESFEAWRSDREHLADELADILEVIDALRQHIGISVKDLDNIRENKRKKMGGFQDLVFLKGTTTQPLEFAGSRPGVIPLFLDDNFTASELKWPMSKESIDQIMTVELGEKPHDIIKITAPLVPPVRRGIKIRELPSKIGNYNVEVIYDNAQLVVKISTKVEKPPAEQLSLFPEMQQADED